jgi:site-specific recombinase XerD
MATVRQHVHLAETSPAAGALEARLIQEWLETKRSAHTRRSYGRTVQEFRTFTRKGLAAVAVRDLLDFRGALEARISKPAAINQRMAAVKSLISYCHRAGYLAVNPGAVVKPLPVPEDLAQRILEVADILAIIARVRDQRNHAMLSMLYYAGARVSEICSLTWRDLQPRDPGGQVTLYGKGGKTRTVKLPVRVWKELQELREDSPESDPVFRSCRSGGFLHPSQVARIVKAAAVDAGMSGKVSPHWFRHGHASHALDNGCPIHVLRESLGHSSLATTSRYAHARPTESSSDYLK